MCYLPVKCLKVIVFLGSICSIAISIALLALTIYVQVEKKQIISAASQSAVTGSLIALYLSSILFLLLGVAGLSGSMKGIKGNKKENSGTCLLGLFSIGVMIFFIFFLIATIFFFVGPQAIFGTDCRNGSKTTLVKELYDASNEAYSQFCLDGCPCKINNQNSELYNAISTNLPGANISTTFGVQKFGDCKIPFQSTTTNIQIMAALQNLLQCGGWCPDDDQKKSLGFYYYRFKNINECDSADCYSVLQNCHDKFEDFMTGSGQIVGFGCLGALLVCLLNIIAVCCICFHPDKVKKGSNFYSRMIEMD